LTVPPSDEPGTAPGEVEPEDVEDEPQPGIWVFSYDPDGVNEIQDAGIDEALEQMRSPGNTWVNVDGLEDLELLERLWDECELHPLIREDIVTVGQRPKFEEYEEQDVLVLQMTQLVREELQVEQVSIAFADDWIVSFQETYGDVFDDVRDRIRKGRPRILSGGPDYLAYSLPDAIVDGHFPILEQYGEWIEETEPRALDDPAKDTIAEIHELKRDLLTIRRSLWPLREAVNHMQRAEGSPTFTKRRARSCATPTTTWCA